MRTYRLGALAAMALAALLCVGATDPEIAQHFVSRADALFASWVSNRPADQVQRALGTMGTPIGEDCVAPDEFRFFEFLACRDLAPPAKASIDVRRNDSLLTPMIHGVIEIETNESCVMRRLEPPNAYAEDFWQRLQRACTGATYEQCQSAGGRFSKGKTFTTDCKGLGRIEYPVKDRITILYRWTGDSWEYESATGISLRRPPPEDDPVREWKPGATKCLQSDLWNECDPNSSSN